MAIQILPEIRVGFTELIDPGPRACSTAINSNFSDRPSSHQTIGCSGVTFDVAHKRRVPAPVCSHSVVLGSSAPLFKVGISNLLF